MRSVRTALVLLAIVSMPSIARGQARDCVETTPDLNDAIACLKGMYRPQLENCQKTPLRGWSAPVEGRRVLDFGVQCKRDCVRNGAGGACKRTGGRHRPLS